jgi:hypothetical protein
MNANGHHVFGVASIDATGTIRLRVLSQCADAPQPCAEVCYERSHPSYAAVLEQIGPIAVGEEKVIHPEKIA